MLVNSDVVELGAMFIDPRLERFLFGLGKARAHFDLLHAASLNAASNKPISP